MGVAAAGGNAYETPQGRSSRPHATTEFEQDSELCPIPNEIGVQILLLNTHWMQIYMYVCMYVCMYRIYGQLRSPIDGQCSGFEGYLRPTAARVDVFTQDTHSTTFRWAYGIPV